MKTIFVSLLAIVAALQLPATPLKIVSATAPRINCIFNTTCVVPVADSDGVFQLGADLGNGLLISRTVQGEAGAPLAGLYGYEYRVDLRSVAAQSLPANGVVRFTINFGAPIPYDFDG